MQLTVAEAHQLAVRIMSTLGHDTTDATLIADHLIDCELRGLNYGGLARAISIAERIGRTGDRRRPISIRHETPVSAQLDGGDHLGYIVAHRATAIAVDKALAAGIAVVGADDTWYTGMLSYYAEIAAARGLVTMIASNASPWVAPHGATEGRFGTNPMCFGFPSADEPVIWDVGTSAIIHAEATLAQRLGQRLPEGVAFDPDGNSTRDPAAALAGAFAAWGGHKGSGLGIVVQLLGIMAGSPDLASSSSRCVRICWDRPTDFTRTCQLTRKQCEAHGRSRAAMRCGCRSTGRGGIARAGLPRIASRCPMCCSSS
jgi:delta1-piperideine-2-carboxylate reductase